jgi:hypothetical protein
MRDQQGRVMGNGIHGSLAQTHVDTVVEELVGDYSPPTILVDGFDVTGRPRGTENQASCQLDLPTQEQILGALTSYSSTKVLQRKIKDYAVM